MYEERILQGQEPQLINLCISPFDHRDHPLILARSGAQEMLLNKWKEMNKEPCFLRTIWFFKGKKNIYPSQ